MSTYWNVNPVVWILAQATEDEGVLSSAVYEVRYDISNA